MKRLLLTTLLLGSQAQASSDSGVISNWNQFASAMQTVTDSGGLGANYNAGELQTLSARFGQGRFQVKFNDAMAARLADAEPTPSKCPTVKKTPGLRTLLMLGVVMQTKEGILRLTREGRAGNYKVYDAWVYASQNGSIVGTCRDGLFTNTFRINLRQGWNLARVYSDDMSKTSILQNAPAKTLPWMLRK